MKPVDFMKYKVKMKSRIDSAKLMLNGPKAALTRIEVADKRLTAEQRSQLSSNTIVLTDKLKELLAAAQVLNQNVESCKPETASPVETKIARFEKEVAAAEKEAGLHHDAMQWLLTEARKNEKSKQSATRYKRAKTTNKLVEGGHGSQYSKWLAPKLFDEPDPSIVLLNPGDVTPERVCLWRSGDTLSENMKMVMQFNTIDDKKIEVLKSRTTKLHAALKSNPSWGGAMMNTTMEPDAVDKWPKAAKQSMSETEGTDTWIFVNKPNQWRHGPNSWPLPGLGAYVRITTDQITIQIFDIQGLLEKGISIGDLAAYLETSSGLDYAKASAIVMRLTKDSLIWIPYGKVAMCLSVANTFNDESVEEDVGVMYSYVIFEKSLALALNTVAWSAIVDFNVKHFEKAPGKLWKPRAALFNKFVAEVSP
jgi:hypothetical protein